MSYRESKGYYKKEYHSKTPNKNWSGNNDYYSRYEHNPRKSHQVNDSYSNHSNNHHSQPKYDTSKYTSTSRKSTRESANSHKSGEKRTERNFLEYIGVETNENTIAKRQHQIDAAKASLAYARYSMLVAKNQRITDMPQTPNKFMKTDTDRWMQMVKKWVKQLRGWEIPGSLSLPSPVWVPEEKRPQESSPTPPPLLDYESESSEESPEKYRAPKRGVFYEKKNERKRRRSFTPSPPRERSYNYNSQTSLHKYPRTPHDTKYPSRGYTKKIHYEAFSNTEDFVSNSPKVERKVSYVKDYGPRFTHTTRPATSNQKEDLRLRMKSNNHRNYRNDTERTSYTNISWSPENSPRRPTHSGTHYSSYGRPRSLDVIPRDRLTSPITPPTPLRKEITPEFDIPGQDWEMKNEVVLLDV